jgi:hypothetical protein
MNIGFFGDSYADTMHNLQIYEPLDDRRPWCRLLFDEFASEFISSGKGGHNQYYAIHCWNAYLDNTIPMDVAIFTFTWDARLYHHYSHIREFLAAYQEKRTNPNLTDEEKNILDAIDKYRTYLESPPQIRFVHELIIKYILELPEQHKDIKFIFLPNNDYSLELAKKHFKKGILLDFAFDKITALEGEDVHNPDQSKMNHLTEVNHFRFKDLIKNIILSYNTHEDKVYPVDYEQFRID